MRFGPSVNLAWLLVLIYVVAPNLVFLVQILAFFAEILVKKFSGNGGKLLKPNIDGLNGIFRRFFVMTSQRTVCRTK